MPKSATTKKSTRKPAAPVAATPPPAPEVAVMPPPVDPGLPVIYPTLEIDEYSTVSAKGPLDAEWCADALGWETETEFRARMLAKHPGTKADAWTFGDVYHCRNIAGEKVRCNNNAHNRPFDMAWCESLVHTTLCGQWAGPHTVPGETVNGETVRISRYGRVLSGQHQMTACVLAQEVLDKARRDGVGGKYPTWTGKDKLFIETIVVKGMSEDPRILMTVDYVKPRSAADVFYTSEVFRDSTPSERRELCRILASAVDVLWVRTDTRGYRTHPEVVAFLERHKRLMKCVVRVYQENTQEAGRKLTLLRLQPGAFAAWMYLMASSGPRTDGDVYRNEEPAPSEKNLDWSLWDKAEEFLTLLTQGADFALVRNELVRLLNSTPVDDDNQGFGGRAVEKAALVEKAWTRWRDHTGAGAVFTPEDVRDGGDLRLCYTDLDDSGKRLPDGQLKLVDVADFGGIDCPTVVGGRGSAGGAPMPPPPTREEIERATAEARARRAK